LGEVSRRYTAVMEAATFDDAGARRAATATLAILTFINLFNYVDRWVVAAVVESLHKSDLHLTDAQIGFIPTGFLIVYMLTSPVFGTLGDRKRRPPLIALGVAIWSIATALAGFARGFVSLMIARSTVGVGEAAYGTIAPALLADAFPFEKRGRVFSIFFAAIPVGSAAGYVIGGLVDQHYGWRAAFFIAGIPGIILSLLVLTVKDPPRGAHDAVPLHAQRSVLTDYAGLLRNSRFIITALGYGAYTFALGGLAFWFPAFLERIRGMTHSEATVTFGSIALGTGVVGTIVGGWIGDRLLARTKQAYLWVCGVTTLLAAVPTWIAVTSTHRPTYITAIVIAEIFIFMSTGPVNSALVNAVAPNERATALGLSVLLMHIVGDIPSPPIIGIVSSHSSLDRGMLILPGAVVVAGLIWCWAAWKVYAEHSEASPVAEQ